MGQILNDHCTKITHDLGSKFFSNHARNYLKELADVILHELLLGPSRSPSGRRLAKHCRVFLCITTNKYLVRVLVVLLHARFSVVGPIPFLLAAIFPPGHPYIGSTTILPDIKDMEDLVQMVHSFTHVSPSGSSSWLLSLIRPAYFFAIQFLRCLHLTIMVFYLI